MLAHLQAIEARLDPLAATHLISAPPNTLPPYYIIDPVALPAGEVDRDVTAADPELSFEFRIRSVANSGTGSLIMSANAKDALSPLGNPTSLDVTGRRVDVIHVRFESAHTDDSVTLPTTNRHPAVAVEAYQVWSSPTA